MIDLPEVRTHARDVHENRDMTRHGHGPVRCAHKYIRDVDEEHAAELQRLIVHLKSRCRWCGAKFSFCEVWYVQHWVSLGVRTRVISTAGSVPDF
jgi:hypothetical protein